MNEIYIEPLLEVYDWETMDPKDRWDQEQLIELERFLELEQLALMQDELEQIQQTEAVQTLQQEQRNHKELIQLQQWENIVFLIQQYNQD
ncbi:unnamed protein product [Didymodactylos carnosus]|uniref:Uncharacterized protein n=1 Tax=Didymodactylos carnosus TaxID=1234261 RepID=A0A814SMZ5_9BILA|nr:unnamed protein product [Didymodactylos carnosus]CAF1150416.1 unnamed protein product [Didymodactylos carnosus]CAF3625906.1 unnamed protein product [Didymodactylos carnosus]CAF3913971.1 unnamed protein product [Didymodactylos carnosus]